MFPRLGLEEDKKPQIEIEVNSQPLFVCRAVKSFPKMGTAKSKEKIQIAPKKKKKLGSVPATCEISENIMRICVDLMPVLALAKEAELSNKEAKNDSDTDLKFETSNDRELCVQKVSEEMVKSRCAEIEKTVKLSPRFSLPPIIEFEECNCQKAKRMYTPLPPIKVNEKTTTPNSEKSCQRRDGQETEEEVKRLPWIDNPKSSKCRSDVFRLPDISLCSLDSLLQTVSRKLRKRSRDEERQLHLDALLRSDDSHERSLLQKINHCTDKKHVTAIKEKKSLPLLWSPPKPDPVFTLSKNDLLNPTNYRDLFTATGRTC